MILLNETHQTTLQRQSSTLTERRCASSQVKTNSIQVLLYGVKPTLSRTSWLTLCTIQFPTHSLVC